MKTYTATELAEIIERHGKWLRDEDGGEPANLSYANLSYADLSYANLSYANLSYADLRYANLSYANLSYADLRYAVGGSGDRVQCLQIHPYKIIILDKETVWGGCTKKTAEEWLAYDGAELPDSDRDYLARITKPFIRMVCEVQS